MSAAGVGVLKSLFSLGFSQSLFLCGGAPKRHETATRFDAAITAAAYVGGPSEVRFLVRQLQNALSVHVRNCTFIESSAAHSCNHFDSRMIA